MKYFIIYKLYLYSELYKLYEIFYYEITKEIFIMK